MYVRIAEEGAPIHHFGTCVGGNNLPTRWPSEKAGQPTDGSKSFWLGIEPFGEKWQSDYDAYWCEMPGSPPRGQTWGNSFIHDRLQCATTSTFDAGAKSVVVICTAGLA